MAFAFESSGRQQESSSSHQSVVGQFSISCQICHLLRSLWNRKLFKAFKSFFVCVTRHESTCFCKMFHTANCRYTMYDVFVGYLWRLDLVIHEIDKQRRFTIFQNILFVFIRKLGVFTKYFVLQIVVFCTISMSKYGIFGYLYKQPQFF